MPRIPVTDSKELLYQDIIDLLREIRLTLSPSDLKATLNRHVSIRNFLISQQKVEICDLEKRIDELTKID